MQPAADLGIFQLAQVAVDLDEQVVKCRVVERLADACCFHSEVPMDLGSDQAVPDLASDRRKLAGIERRDACVLVEQSLERRKVVVGVRP